LSAAREVQHLLRILCLLSSDRMPGKSPAMIWAYNGTVVKCGPGMRCLPAYYHVNSNTYMQYRAILIFYKSSVVHILIFSEYYVITYLPVGCVGNNATSNFFLGHRQRFSFLFETTAEPNAHFRV
jgi:hypothetical protein